MTLHSNAQRVVNACESNWEANKSDCNAFVRAVAGELGITLTGNADGIIDFLSTNNAFSTASGSEAAAKAEEGYLVIGGLKGAGHSPPRAHGHVVVVVPGPLAHGRYPSAYWGTLGGTGRKNATTNWAWNSSDRDSVTYFGLQIP